MGLFDRFRRRSPGGPAAVSARLEGAMARRRLRGWNPPLENINAMVASGGPRLLALCLDSIRAVANRGSDTQASPDSGTSGAC